MYSCSCGRCPLCRANEREKRRQAQKFEELKPHVRRPKKLSNSPQAVAQRWYRQRIACLMENSRIFASKSI